MEERSTSMTTATCPIQHVKSNTPNNHSVFTSQTAPSVYDERISNTVTFWQINQSRQFDVKTSSWQTDGRPDNVGSRHNSQANNTWKFAHREMWTRTTTTVAMGSGITTGAAASTTVATHTHTPSNLAPRE